MKVLKKSVSYILLGLAIVSTTSLAQNHHPFQTHIPTRHISQHTHYRETISNYNNPHHHHNHRANTRVGGIPTNSIHRKYRHTRKHLSHKSNRHYYRNDSYRNHYSAKPVRRHQPAYYQPITIYLKF